MPADRPSSCIAYWEQIVLSSDPKKKSEVAQIDLEMWRFLLGQKRREAIVAWEHSHPVSDPSKIQWVQVIQELPWVRVKAIQVLRKMDHKAQIYASMLALADSRWTVRQQSARWLGNAGTSAKVAIPSLISLFHDPHKEVRIAGIEACGQLGATASEAIPFLQQLLKQALFWEVSKKAKEALEKIQSAIH